MCSARAELLLIINSNKWKRTLIGCWNGFTNKWYNSVGGSILFVNCRVVHLIAKHPVSQFSLVSSFKTYQSLAAITK